MAVTRYKVGTESATLVSTEADSLANGSECASFTLDNSGASDKWPYAKIRVTISSYTPTKSPVTLRLYGPNADAPASARSTDVGAGAYWQQDLDVDVATGAKVLEFLRVPLDPFALEVTLENNTGADFGSPVEVYWQGYTEEGAAS